MSVRLKFKDFFFWDLEKATKKKEKEEILRHKTVLRKVKCKM